MGSLEANALTSLSVRQVKFINPGEGDRLRLQAEEFA